MLLLKALILGIVEGLTEFLPISSTGHLILAGDLLGFNTERGKLFEIVIQSGAILAVVWEYRERLLKVARGATSDPAAQKFILNLFIAFLPLAILGLAFGKAIKANLFNPIAVATTFIIGALVILWAERREHKIRVQTVEEMSIADAFKLGIAQAFALIPGTSRSGATIIGGLLFGLSQLLFVWGVVRCMRGVGDKASDRVWEGAQGLEWEIPSPAPYHTFETPPVVK